jgi:riboflavin synthase
MTRTLQLTVGPDGRVTVSGARSGQTATVEIDEASETPERLTLANARTDEERDQIIAEIRRAAQELKRQAGIGDDERLSLTHGDLLYDENGLPA